jgi:hypothetical protein
MSHIFDRHNLGAAVIVILAGCSAADQPMAAVGASPLESAGIASDAGPVDPSAASAAEAALSDPSLLAKLSDLALGASSRAGVQSPKTMVVVMAPDQQAAQLAISGGFSPGNAPVYIIEMTGGTFAAARHPFGEAAPQSDILALCVDAATLRVISVHYLLEAPNLNKVGSGMVDLLAQ